MDIPKKGKITLELFEKWFPDVEFVLTTFLKSGNIEMVVGTQVTPEEYVITRINTKTAQKLLNEFKERKK